MHFRVHHKITIIIVLTVGFILSGVCYFLNENLREHTYQRIRADLSKESSLAKSYLQGRVFEDTNIQVIDRLAGQIGKDLNVRATVIDLHGDVIGDSELDVKDFAEVENHLYRPEVQDALKTGFGESRRFSTTIQTDMLYIARAFGVEKTQGIIRLSIPLSDIEVVTENLKQMLFFSLFWAFVIAILIGLVASMVVSRPLQEISSVAKGIAGGDYSKKVLLSSRDEIGNLGKSINYMSDQIKSKIEEITSNQSRFETVLLSMFEGVMVIDGQGAILLMNDTLKDLLSVEGDPVGRRPLEVIRNIDLQEMTEKVLNERRVVGSGEITVFLPEEKTLQVHATPIIREGEPDGAVLVFHDITALRQLEVVRRDFVANVSHELRTPITSIKGYAETLLHGALDDKENAKEFLKIISMDSNRLTQLVDDLLDLSRIESGKLNLNMESCDISSVIDRVIQVLEKRARERGISIKKQVFGDLPQIQVDIDSITQVLLNLADNAVKYSDQGGTVIISAKEQGANIVAEVTDRGVGISADDIPRIFERFYRVDKARSRQLGGTGLGLSIAKHIIQIHGGEITIESELGKGSTFRIILPKG